MCLTKYRHLWFKDKFSVLMFRKDVTIHAKGPFINHSWHHYSTLLAWLEIRNIINRLSVLIYNSCRTRADITPGSQLFHLEKKKSSWRVNTLVDLHRIFKVTINVKINKPANYALKSFWAYLSNVKRWLTISVVKRTKHSVHNWRGYNLTACLK